MAVSICCRQVFFKVYSDNIHRIAHYAHRCIRHSIIYITVFMNFLDGNHERGAMSFNEHNIVRFGHLLWTKTSQDARPSAVREFFAPVDKISETRPIWQC